MERELTMSEILTDPLIRVMLKADGISPSDFAEIIHKAAARLNRPSQSISVNGQITHPRELIWHEQALRTRDATIELHTPAFPSPTPAFA
jgi:hypothetical protein